MEQKENTAETYADSLQWKSDALYKLEAALLSSLNTRHPDK